MAGYTLYTGGPYKQRTGSAITALSTDVNGGSAKNVSSNENFRRSDWQEGNSNTPNLVGGVEGVNAGDYTQIGGTFTLDSISATAQGLTEVDFGSSHSLVITDVVLIPEISDKAYRIVSISSTQAIVINESFTENEALLGSLVEVTLFKNNGSIGGQTSENFIMKKNDATVHGQANTDLQSGAADYVRNKVHRITALRTSRITTAIRAGYYNIFTGQFSTAPTVANDYTSMDLDGSNVPDEEAKDSTTKYGTKGELAYNHGGRAVKQQDYEAKTG